MRTVVCARLTDESSAVGALLTDVVTAGSKPPGTKIQRGNSLVVPWARGARLAAAIIGTDPVAALGAVVSS